ncbi:MAG: aminopeptidase [Candidatus Woesearchaeota archaeon]
MTKKTALQQLQEKILVKKEIKPVSKEATAFCEDYKEFLSENKTEREVISWAVQQAQKAGYKDLRETTSVQKGGTYYAVNSEKNFALITFSDLEEIHAIGSHADSPCLHLKPYPLAENNKLALLKTHYYGGIKKYQYLNIPLSLRGVAYTQEGKRVDFSIGDKPEDPVLSIPDLLPHLSRDQMVKEAKKLVEGEQLNALIASTPVDDETISNKAKLAIAKHLYEEYGLIEEDLISAELLLVPAGKARDLGLDKSMISAYGQDDRVCVYTSIQAHLQAKKSPVTQITLLYDKEEIGSYGKTGAQNHFFTEIIEELIDKTSSKKRVSHVYKNTKVLSADVTAAIDPNFSDVHDSTNANYLGCGVSLEKFGGAGGKYSTNDADAEYMRALTNLFNKNNVQWQTGELGKIDLGGGGTIAMYLAKWGADVVDMGPAVLAMHAPHEITHKNDVHNAYLAYKAFYENKL